jgi:hypothetical protein
MADKKQKIQYYTMVTEKFLDILDAVTQEQMVVSDILKESVSTVKIDKWNEKETSDVIETYVVMNSFKKLLENKIRNPTKEEIKFANEHDIKDVLLTEEELITVQRFIVSVAEQKDILYIDHNISLTVH